MAPWWLKFYQFLVLYIEKNTFLKFFYYVPDFVGFQTRVILDLYGVPFHPMVVVGSEHDFSIKSDSAYCVRIFIKASVLFYIKPIISCWLEPNCPVNSTINSCGICECSILGQAINGSGNICECYIEGQVLNDAGDACECPINGQVVNNAGTACECFITGMVVNNNTCECPSIRQSINATSFTCECSIIGQILNAEGNDCGE